MARVNPCLLSHCSAYAKISTLGASFLRQDTSQMCLTSLQPGEGPEDRGAAKKAFWESINNGLVTPLACFFNCRMGWEHHFQVRWQRFGAPQKHPALQSREKGDSFHFPATAGSIQSPLQAPPNLLVPPQALLLLQESCSSGSDGWGKLYPERGAAWRQQQPCTHGHTQCFPGLPAANQLQLFLDSSPTAWPCCFKSWELCHGVQELHF